MKIHEYQAKELFQKYQVPVPRGKVAFSVDESKAVAAELASLPVVIKAQIHAGGRGKGGGVKLAKTVAEVPQVASEILGVTLVTHQTGPECKPVRRLLVEEGLQIEKELYFSMLPDRATASTVIMASEAGGMDIEEVAAKTPEKIIKVQVNPLLGLQAFHVRQLAYGLNLQAELIKPFSAMVTSLYKLFCDYDCSLVEINPLVITADKMMLALDAKVNFDDNALFRHKVILEYRDLHEEDPLEVEASQFNLNYIKMDGNIGNMVKHPERKSLPQRPRHTEGRRIAGLFGVRRRGLRHRNRSFPGEQRLRAGELPRERALESDAYVHISPNPILNVGDSVRAYQTVIGTILPGLGHVHFTHGTSPYMNAIRPNGGFSPYTDLYPPDIRVVKFFIDDTENELTGGRVSGRVDIRAHIAETSAGTPGDVTGSTSNNGTYIAGYRILTADRSAVVYEPPVPEPSTLHLLGSGLIGLAGYGRKKFLKK